VHKFESEYIVSGKSFHRLFGYTSSQTRILTFPYQNRSGNRKRITRPFSILHNHF
jgi:hypothetical protein